MNECTRRPSERCTASIMSSRMAACRPSRPAATTSPARSPRASARRGCSRPPAGRPPGRRRSWSGRWWGPRPDVVLVQPGHGVGDLHRRAEGGSALSTPRPPGSPAPTFRTDGEPAARLYCARLGAPRLVAHRVYPCCKRRPPPLRGLPVQRVEQLGVTIVDDVALDLQGRRQLAVLDRQVAGQDREPLDLLDLGVVGVGAVELLLISARTSSWGELGESSGSRAPGPRGGLLLDRA